MFDFLRQLIGISNKNKQYIEFDDAIIKNLVEIKEFFIFRSLNLSNEGDAGMHIFLDIGKNKTLILEGQWPIELEEQFPNNKIRLYYRKDLGITDRGIYHVQAIGEKVYYNDSYAIEDFSDEQIAKIDKYFLWNQVVDISYDEIVNHIKSIR